MLPCPFNYGVAPDLPAEDGAGQDVIVIGPRLPRGTQVKVRPTLRVVFVDQGIADDKLVARVDGRAVNGLDRCTLTLFFFIYSIFKRLRYRLQGAWRGPTGVAGYEPMSEDV